MVGPPELVVEISASSVSYDLHPKLRAYERNGVQEYLVWLVEDESIEWFVLRRKKYQKLKPEAGAIFKSEVFPGLWLDADALIGGDLERVDQVLQEGLRSPEHAEFVARLRGVFSARKKDKRPS